MKRKRKFKDNSADAIKKRVLADFKAGKLRSGGPKGPVVKNFFQALMIAKSIATVHAS